MELASHLMKRRAALRLMGQGAALVALAACGPAAPPAPTVSVAAPTSAPAQPAATTAPQGTPAAAAAQGTPAATRKTGGTLRVGVPADISSLDAHTSSSLLSITQSMAFDRLVAYDVSAKPRPMLAESWDVAPDFKQVKLNIRKGVQWHSGREFTSDDVKWNLLRGQDPKAATGSYVNQAKWFPTIDTPDKYTAILKSDVSRPAIFDYLNILNMVDQVSLGGPDAKTTAIGTGPFIFKEWVQGDHLTYARNSNYWRSGYPYLDGIVVNVVRDLNAMSTRLEAGALDAVYGPPITEFLRFKDDPNYQALIPPGQQAGMAMGVNTLFPPTDNKLVRQALSYAADRKRFTDQIFKGIVRPLSLPWDSDQPGLRGLQRDLLHVRPRQGPLAAGGRWRNLGRAGLPGLAEHAGVGSDLADLPERPGFDRHQAQHGQTGPGRLAGPGQQPQVPRLLGLDHGHRHRRAGQRPEPGSGHGPELQQRGLQERHLHRPDQLSWPPSRTRTNARRCTRRSTTSCWRTAFTMVVTDVPAQDGGLYAKCTTW